ncbi:MAG: hypothetical protein RR440_00235 [Erysipelotrichaceae bacterium]
MEDKAYWKCDYTYEENGEVITTEYKSPKEFDNSIDPNTVAKILSREIKNETGFTVKSFIRLVEMPVESKEIKHVGDIKVKNPVRIAEISYKVAVTEDEIKEAEENRKNLQNLMVDMLYRYYKKNKDSFK